LLLHHRHGMPVRSLVAIINVIFSRRISKFHALISLPTNQLRNDAAKYLISPVLMFFVVGKGGNGKTVVSTEAVSGSTWDASKLAKEDAFIGKLGELLL